MKLILFNSQLLVFMDMNLIFFALCIFAKFHSAGANEPHGPRNIACLSGTKIIITCAAPENDVVYIDWHHQNSYTSWPTELFNNTGSNISTNYLMLKIENEESLVINSVQLRDAGVYYCATINSKGVSKEVGSHLIVLDSDPTCYLENVTVMEKDYIRLRCSVTYGGLWRPIMEWRQLGFLGQEKINNNSSLVNVTESHQYASMTLSLQILARPYHNGISFVCNTYFDYRDMLVKQKVSNNTPDYNHTWESTKINVLHGSRYVSIYPTSDILYPGDKLTCSALGNPEPEYEWTENETVYLGSQIEIVQSMIRDHPYVFSYKARNSLNESFANITFTVRGRFPPIYFAIASISLLCTLILIGIIIAIRKCVKDTEHQKRSHDSTRVESASAPEASESRAQVQLVSFRSTDPSGAYVEVSQPTTTACEVSHRSPATQPQRTAHEPLVLPPMPLQPSGAAASTKRSHPTQRDNEPRVPDHTSEDSSRNSEPPVSSTEYVKLAQREPLQLQPYAELFWQQRGVQVVAEDSDSETTAYVNFPKKIQSQSEYANVADYV